MEVQEDEILPHVQDFQFPSSFETPFFTYVCRKTFFLNYLAKKNRQQSIRTLTFCLTFCIPSL